ncbi:MAG: nuclear transport factor 2 family protein [Rhodospirillales bacterium]|nr:nuclear transport factor 2 family protein [Rhodospirillales bacterium]
MATTLADLEARLTAMEHIAAIKELQSRYWHNVDRQKLDDVRNCFVEIGAVIDMQGVPPCNDREDFIKVLKANGGKPGFHSLHTGNNPFITLTGPDTAYGVWDAFFIGIDVGDRLTYQLSGEYKNNYVLKDDRWYIQTQRFLQTSLLVQSIAEDGSPKVVTFGLPDDSVFDK